MSEYNSENEKKVNMENQRPDRRYYDAEGNSKKIKGSNIGIPVGTEPFRMKILKLVFISVLVAEAYLCYEWLILPVYPVISDFIANKGTLTFNIGTFDIKNSFSDPLGFLNIGGMKANSFIPLLFNTSIRIAFFSFLFAFTRKGYNMIKSVIR